MFLSFTSALKYYPRITNCTKTVIPVNNDKSANGHILFLKTNPIVLYLLFISAAYISRINTSTYIKKSARAKEINKHYIYHNKSSGYMAIRFLVLSEKQIRKRQKYVRKQRGSGKALFADN